VIESGNAPSLSRRVLALIENSLEAEKRKQQEFFELAELPGRYRSARGQKYG
jgi:hypothetical protein